jgi:hypothetical protein
VLWFWITHYWATWRPMLPSSLSYRVLSWGRPSSYQHPLLLLYRACQPFVQLNSGAAEGRVR